MRAGQRGCPGQRGNPRMFADRDDLGGAAAQTLDHRARGRVIGANHGEVARPLPVEHMPLGRDVARHVAVAVQMVRAEIEHRRRAEPQGGQALQHVARHFQNIDTGVRQQRQRQRGRAKIAPGRHRNAGDVQDVRQQRRRGRLAIGPGDPGETRLRRTRAHRLKQQLGIGPDRHPGGDRGQGGRVRIRTVMRNARRQHQGIEPGHHGPPYHRLGHHQPARRVPRRRRVVPNRDARPHRHQRTRRRQAVAAQPDHGKTLAGKERG